MIATCLGILHDVHEVLQHLFGNDLLMVARPALHGPCDAHLVTRQVKRNNASLWSPKSTIGMNKSYTASLVVQARRLQKGGEQNLGAYKQPMLAPVDSMCYKRQFKKLGTNLLQTKDKHPRHRGIRQNSTQRDTNLTAQHRPYQTKHAQNKTTQAINTQNHPHNWNQSELAASLASSGHA
jgi:hypothetical protein